MTINEYIENHGEDDVQTLCWSAEESYLQKKEIEEKYSELLNKKEDYEYVLEDVIKKTLQNKYNLIKKNEELKKTFDFIINEIEQVMGE